MKKMKMNSEAYKVIGIVFISFVLIVALFNSLMQRAITKAYNEGFEKGNNKTCAWIYDPDSLGNFGETATGKTWNISTNTWDLPINFS